jgi:hypothetical protein
MSAVFAGRYAAHTDEPFVVFFIGIRLNRPWAVWRWLPHLRAMLTMIRMLNRQPQKGMLGSRIYVSPPTFLIVQYWRSFDDMEAFARSPYDLHLPAWKRFNQHIGKSGDVGVFHESYLVTPGQYEAVYVNMPRFGLGAAAQHMPATGSHLTARRRLGGHNDAAVPEP